MWPYQTHIVTVIGGPYTYVGCVCRYLVITVTLFTLSYMYLPKACNRRIAIIIVIIIRAVND